MKPKTYKVLEMCIENGIKYGIARALKHDDKPSTEVIAIAINAAIDYEICEWFDLDIKND
jgi:hypothetical protein